MKLLLVLLLSTPPSWIFGNYASDEGHFAIARGRGNGWSDGEDEE